MDLFQYNIFIPFQLPEQQLETRVAELEIKYPTPTFPKFLTPTPYHKGNEVWLLKSMESKVHSKKSVSTKVLKEIVPFQQEFPTWECDVKNNPIGYPESDKKI